MYLLLKLLKILSLDGYALPFEYHTFPIVSGIIFKLNGEMKSSMQDKQICLTRTCLKEISPGFNFSFDETVCRLKLNPWHKDRWYSICLAHLLVSMVVLKFSARDFFWDKCMLIHVETVSTMLLQFSPFVQIISASNIIVIDFI